MNIFEIIIYFNVLDQFAIKATIFNVDIVDLINYVNKVYFNNDDDFIRKFIGEKPENLVISDPKLLVDLYRFILETELQPSFNKERIKFYTDIIYIY